MAKLVGDYVLLNHIGQGTYGVVHKAQHQVTREIVAIKTVRNSRLTSKKLVEGLEKEINILSTLKHDNIVNLIGIEKTKDETNLIMEYCKGGDFAMYMKKKKKLTEEKAKFFLKQLASALKFMQEQKIIHRDLKPSNILLASDGEDPIIKVADFGYARFLESTQLAETACGTPLYMAPEVFRNKKYDAKADLWSVGCILFEMITGSVPYTGKSQVDLFENIQTQNLSFPTDVSPNCRDILKKLLQKDPKDRIEFSDFFIHPFLTSDSFQSLTLQSFQNDIEDNIDIHQISREAMESMEEIGNPNKLVTSQGQADEMNQLSFMSNSNQIPRPKTKLFKEPSDSSEDDYVVVDQKSIDVNAIADVVNLSPISTPESHLNSSSVPSPSSSGSSSNSFIQTENPTPNLISNVAKNSFSPPSIFSKSFISDFTPTQTGSPPYSSSSPASGSALSKALAFAKYFSSSIVPEEQNTRDIVASIKEATQDASTNEKAIWAEIVSASKRANTIVGAAKKILADSKPGNEEATYYHGYILYLKALSTMHVAIIHARRFWQVKDQTVTKTVNNITQLIRKGFNEYLEKAEELKKRLRGTSYFDIIKTGQIYRDQARLIVEQARACGKEAGIDELEENFILSEKNYSKALFLFESLVAKDLPENEKLNAADRAVIESLIISTKKRLQVLKKKNPPESNF